MRHQAIDMEDALTAAKHILSDYLHFRDDGRAEAIPPSDNFWEALAAGTHPELDQGRLMSAFSFSESWSVWERHPAGEAALGSSELDSR